MSAKIVHALVLSGGSAFGLAAGDGVMRCLEERGVGFDVGVTKVPLVVQSSLFDLTVGDSKVRPDAAMGMRPRGSRWTPRITATAITAPDAARPWESTRAWTGA